MITVLSAKGDVSVELEEKIRAQSDVDMLNDWLKKALTVSTIDEFIEVIFSKELV